MMVTREREREKELDEDEEKNDKKKLITCYSCINNLSKNKNLKNPKINSKTKNCLTKILNNNNNNFNLKSLIKAKNRRIFMYNNRQIKLVSTNPLLLLFLLINFILLISSSIFVVAKIVNDYKITNYKIQKPIDHNILEDFYLINSISKANENENESYSREQNEKLQHQQHLSKVNKNTNVSNNNDNNDNNNINYSEQNLLLLSFLSSLKNQEDLERKYRNFIKEKELKEDERRTILQSSTHSNNKINEDYNHKNQHKLNEQGHLFEWNEKTGSTINSIINNNNNINDDDHHHHTTRKLNDEFELPKTNNINNNNNGFDNKQKLLNLTIISTRKHMHKKRSLNYNDSQTNINNRNNHNQQRQQALRQQQKSSSWQHLSSSSKYRRRVLSPLEQQQQQPQLNSNNNNNNNQFECKNLLIIWNFLKNYYPSLANHLYLIASSEQNQFNKGLASKLNDYDNGDQNHHYNQMTYKLTHSDYFKTINRLLEQADKLLQQQQQNKSYSIDDNNSINAESNHLIQLTNENINNNYRQPSSWLSRVASNPKYAKLISRLQHHYNSRLHLNANDDVVTKIPNENNNNNNNNINIDTNESNNFSRLTNENSLVEGIASVSTTESSSINLQQQQQKQLGGLENSNNNVFGKIIHYPHQMKDFENHGKVVDRLHQLNQIVRDTPTTQTGSSLQSNVVNLMVAKTNDNNNNLANEELESNKIQQLTNNVNGDYADGSKDKNFVYGNILHKPIQKIDFDGQQQNQVDNRHHQHQSSMTTLRRLNGHPEVGHAPLSTSLDSDQSYGRILTIPPNSFHNNYQPEIQLELNNNHNSKASSLQTLKQQLEPVLKNQYFNNDDISSSSSSSNQLQNENGSSPSLSSSSLVDEFEGTFQSMPFEHPEIKQIRAGDFITTNDGGSLNEQKHFNNNNNNNNNNNINNNRERQIKANSKNEFQID